MNTERLQELLRDDPAASTATELLNAAGGTVYIVGGAVRDVILGKNPNDIDLMVTGLTQDQIEQTLNGNGRLDFTGKQFGVYRFKVNNSDVEIAMPRVEFGATDTDFRVDANIPIQDDLGRRDFTANAIAVNTQDWSTVDPYGGESDLNSGTLKVVNPNAFEDDPTRLLRGITAYSKSQLYPDDYTMQAMQNEASRLTAQPPERLQMELDKLLSGSEPAGALQLAHDVGLLKYILPEVDSAMGFDQMNPHHDLDVGSHLLAALSAMTRISNDPDLRLAALLHDIGKPDSFWRDPEAPEGGGGHFYKKVLPDGTSVGEDHEDLGADYADALMQRLRYPNARRERVVFLIRNHMFPYFTNLKGARKFISKCGGDPKVCFDLLALREADSSGKKTGKMRDSDAELIEKDRQLVQQALDQQQATTIRDLAINGRDLIQMGMQPGPQIGEVLQKLLDVVIENPELNDHDTLIGLAQSFLADSQASVTAADANKYKYVYTRPDGTKEYFDDYEDLLRATGPVPSGPPEEDYDLYDHEPENGSKYDWEDDDEEPWWKKLWEDHVDGKDTSPVLQNLVGELPDFKWSWDGEKLDVWPTKSWQAQDHMQRTGPDFWKFAQGRIYEDADGYLELFVWADRGDEKLRDQAVEKVEEWIQEHYGRESDIVTYEGVPWDGKGTNDWEDYSQKWSPKSERDVSPGKNPLEEQWVNRWNTHDDEQEIEEPRSLSLHDLTDEEWNELHGA